jgi:hypothetical protein
MQAASSPPLVWLPSNHLRPRPIDADGLKMDLRALAEFEGCLQALFVESLGS